MNTKKPRLLIIDDDVFSLLTVSNLVTEYFDVEVTSKPEDGFTKAFNTHPDLILLDLEMPGRPGLKILDDLKHLSASKDIPIIIFTAHDKEEYRKLSKQLGARAYLTKPCSLVELKQTLLDAVA